MSALTVEPGFLREKLAAVRAADASGVLAPLRAAMLETLETAERQRCELTGALLDAKAEIGALAAALREAHAALTNHPGGDNRPEEAIAHASAMLERVYRGRL